MSEPTDRPIDLQDVLAFNEQIRILAETGIPFDLGTATREPIREQLQRIQSQITMELGRHRTLEDILQDRQLLPRPYSAALRTWLECDRSETALDMLTATAVTERDIRTDFEYSLIHPLLLALLVYGGWIYLVLYVGPRLEHIYQQIGAAPGIGLSWLIYAGTTFAYWVVTLPILLLLLVLWRRSSSTTGQLRFAQSSQVVQNTRAATYAMALFRLLERDQTREQAVALLGPYPNGDRKSESMPPLLGWALKHSSEAHDPKRALRLAADTYRAVSMDQASQWKKWLPMIFGAALGGTLVLAFGVSLFYPMVELLIQLAKP